MDESRFHQCADRTLEQLVDQLETQDPTGALEVELASGVLSIELPTGKQFVVNKHATSRELWLSSPISGGLHFPYVDGQWKLKDERTLHSILSLELTDLLGYSVELS